MVISDNDEYHEGFGLSYEEHAHERYGHRVGNDVWRKPDNELQRKDDSEAEWRSCSESVKRILFARHLLDIYSKSITELWVQCQLLTLRRATRQSSPSCSQVSARSSPRPILKIRRSISNAFVTPVSTSHTSPEACGDISGRRSSATIFQDIGYLGGKNDSISVRSSDPTLMSLQSSLR